MRGRAGACPDLRPINHVLGSDFTSRKCDEWQLIRTCARSVRGNGLIQRRLFRRWRNRNRTRVMEPQLEELLTRYHLSPSEELVARLSKYLALLQKWNRRMNLTASTDWTELRPFFEEAIWASSFYPDRSVRHLDVGSGAGFPALIIRIVKPRMLLDLLERRSKRAVFLQTAVRELELNGSTVHNYDFASFLRLYAGSESWDIVSSKGVRWSKAELARLGGLARQLWMFHGGEFTEVMGLDEFSLYKRAQCPGHPSWYLSVFQRTDA
jgi:16S rRNA (guanine(527)-N(7))-methyltransferase RsmG